MNHKNLIAYFLIAAAMLCGLVFCDDNSTENPSNTFVPARPENPSVSILASTSVLFQWDDASGNEESFLVYRAEKGAFAHIATNAANNNAYIDSLLDDTTFYRYYVTASNTAGSSAPSETVSVTTPATGFAPAAPHNPSPADDSTGVPRDVILSWQCSDPDGDPLVYDIFLGTGAYLNFLDSSIAVPSYAIEMLDYGVTYNWKVVARDDDYHYTEGPVWHFTVGDTIVTDTSFYLYIEISGQGQVTVEPDRPRFDPGDTVTLTAMPEPGWYFWGWGGDLPGTGNPLTVVMTQDFNLDAIFEESLFNLDVEIIGQGEVTVDPDLPRYDPGDSVTLIATPDGGWYFWGWGYDLHGANNPLTVIMTQDYYIAAYFEQIADSTTTRISGIVTWPGHQLSQHVYAFADSDYSGTPRVVAQTDVNPSDGTFTITIEEQPGTLWVEFQAHDDVNGNGPWDPIDPVDGWGFYDANGDSIRNDYFLIPPGAHIDSVRITLRSANE